jgi:hypothetical protein
MAIIENGATSTQAKVEVGSFRTTLVPRGDTYAVSAVTGTVGAALVANSSVFAMRLDPSSARLAFIERIRLQYTTIVAYTTPITAGRRLALFRGSGAAAGGGTAITAAVSKSTTSPLSEFNTAQGGDMRVATTGALTVTGITFEADPIRTMSLVHVGNAGNYAESLWEFHASECAPVVLQPGQLLAIRNPAAMDAAGTWQLVVNVDWHEAVALA